MGTITVSTSPLLDLLFDEPSVGRCLVAPDGTVLRANAEWLRSTGFTLDEALGADIIGLFPGTRDMSLAMHARARAGHHVEVPRHAQRLQGRESWWEGTIDPVPMVGGTGLLITSREVSRPQAGASARQQRTSPAGVLARIRAIADHAPCAVFVKGADGRYLFTNRWLQELLGLRSGEAVGKTVADLLPAPVAERAIERDRRVAAGQEEVASEDTVPTTRGDRTLMTVRFPFRLDDGSVGTFGIAVDVTERRRAESALRESEERCRLLAEAMPQIVCVLGPDGTPEYVNPSWVAYSGLDLEASTRAGWSRVLHPDDAAAALDVLRRVLTQLGPQEVELRYRAADGTYRWFLSRLAPVVEHGRVIRLIGAAMEIEDRKRAEAALRASEEQARARAAELEALVDAVPAAVFISRDPEVRQLDGNRVVFELLGQPRGANLSKTGPLGEIATGLRVLRRGVELPPGELPMQRAARGEEVRGGEFDVQLEGGETRCFLGNAMPLRDATGAISGAIGAFIDVTAQRRLEEALREADRRKDQFLSMLSHELRNPLAPIRNSIYVLRHADGGEHARRAKDVIERQTEHLTRLVDDLLDLTRIARGKIQLRRDRVDLREIVRRSAEDLRPALEQRGATFRLELPPDPLPAIADPTRIAQVVGNLLNNAAKFTPAKGEVTLSIRADGDDAELAVTDTGAGIEASLLPRVFEPFVQGERTLAGTQGGLGLGLALVKGIAELHGGTVRAESRGPGQGTTMTVRIPLDRPAPAKLRREAPPSKDGPRGRRVLVVDDNHDAADSLADIVAMLGHTPEVAYDGPTAVAKVRERAPDVVLCDIGLPGMSGYEVATQIRASTDDVRLVAVTGYAQPEDLARAADAGFDSHLAKPADPQRIRDVIE